MQTSKNRIIGFGKIPILCRNVTSNGASRATAASPRTADTTELPASLVSFTPFTDPFFANNTINTATKTLAAPATKRGSIWLAKIRGSIAAPIAKDGSVSIVAAINARPDNQASRSFGLSIATPNGPSINCGKKCVRGTHRKTNINVRKSRATGIPLKTVSSSTIALPEIAKTAHMMTQSAANIVKL